jgi:predicted nuclease of predicted toxin-antitoxin system
MRFLVDDQLPVALARFIASAGHSAEHVSDAGLTGQPDPIIWAHARTSGAVIISKDFDFVRLQSLEPEGPSVVWLRMGNTRKKQLLERMLKIMPIIVEGLENGQKLIEIR